MWGKRCIVVLEYFVDNKGSDIGVDPDDESRMRISSLICLTFIPHSENLLFTFLLLVTYLRLGFI